MGRTKRACHLYPILGAWDAVVITCTPVRFLSTWGVVMLRKKKKKKKTLYITTISNIMHTILKVVNACQGNTNGVKRQVLTGKCHTQSSVRTSQWLTTGTVGSFYLFILQLLLCFTLCQRCFSSTYNGNLCSKKGQCFQDL